MKCFELKNGEIIPADKVVDFRTKGDKLLVKYTKYATFDGVDRKMTCYDEAKQFREMTEEEEEEFGIE